ncbi:hypothetical protein [Cupriavidus sp.]|uniref:hypothetical protein n=1 Tax=Cupriavidus sp. TaxID=1873897 RepID=UPI003D0D1083
MRIFGYSRIALLALLPALVIAGTAQAQWKRPPAVPSKIGWDPSDAADVVGRNLDLWGIGSIGHVGIWSGNHVIEALNTPGNAINTNTLADFKSRTRYWGSAFVAGLDRLPQQRMCSDAACSYLITLGMKHAIVQNAKVIGQVGADYTVTDGYISARPACRPPMCASYRPQMRGQYRCDKFVIDAYTPLSNGNSTMWTALFRSTTPESLFMRLNERGIEVGKK